MKEINVVLDSCRTRSDNKLAKLLAIPCYITAVNVKMDVELSSDTEERGRYETINNCFIVACSVDFCDINGENEGSFKLTPEQHGHVWASMNNSDRDAIEYSVWATKKRINEGWDYE